MSPTQPPPHPRITRIVLSAGLTALLLSSASALQGSPVPKNLGNGLDKLVKSRQATTAGGQARGQSSNNLAAAPEAAGAAALAMSDDQGRVMVDIYLSGKEEFSRLLTSLPTRFPSLQITAFDASYRAGVIEGYVGLDEAAALAQARGVSSVILAPRPVTNAIVGSVDDQGVTQHRVNQINQTYNPAAPVNYDGAGITVGVLSDAFDGVNATSRRYVDDVASGDLPGPGNPLNPQPVVVFQDQPFAFNEGRALSQIVYKMAPKVRLGFATAFNGAVSYADNIRSLAGLPSGSRSRPDFKADVIVEDVVNLNEPYFEDGIVAQAVKDVVHAGVSHFSAAGNDPGKSAYDSDFRLVPNGQGLTAATNTALAGTNVDLTGVPPALYAGGFHNFRADGGRDVAQLVNLARVGSTPFVLQWNDPFDELAPQVRQPPVFGPVTGTVPAGTATADVAVALSQGSQYQISVTANADSPELDVVVAVLDPNGNQILQQDTYTDEIVTFFAPTTGSYTVRVSSYTEAAGNFTLVVNQTTAGPRITTDFNVLFFRADNGEFISGLTSDNFATNQPIELSLVEAPAGQTQIQLVICRANTPTAPRPADHLRYLFPVSSPFSVGPAEYFDYLTPTTYGHSTVAGANSVAAYGAFRPYIPEVFTSPGPATIYFDADRQRLAAPEVRLKPDIAAMDGGNTTFFGSDTNRDTDTAPNIFGTSAAAPHAAAIGALVLQTHGGPRSLSPAQLKDILRRSAFPHDLDPLVAGGSATVNGSTVTVTARSDNSYNPGIGGQDPNALKVSYAGPSSLVSILFDATRGNVTGGNIYGSYPGLVFDTRPVSTDGVPDSGGFPFTVGSASVGLTAADVRATTAVQAPPPSVGGEFYLLNLTFTPGVFTGGKVLSFGIDRDEQHSAFFPQALPPGGGNSINGSSADLLGGGVNLPQGNVVSGGVTFFGGLADGTVFRGTVANRIGAGYSPLDGYGFINAQRAVSLSPGQPVP